MGPDLHPAAVSGRGSAQVWRGASGRDERLSGAGDVGGGAAAGGAVEGDPPPWASSESDRSGIRSTAAELQEGQTSGFWSRSAAIRISASGARYSLMPRRPTVGPSGGVWWHGSGYPTLSLNVSEAIRSAQRCARSDSRCGEGLTMRSSLRVLARLSVARRCARRRVVGAGDACGAARWPTRLRTSTGSSRPGWSSGRTTCIVFQVVSGAPHSVVFEGEGSEPWRRGVLNSAMPNRSGDLSSPLLHRPARDTG